MVKRSREASGPPNVCSKFDTHTLDKLTKKKVRSLVKRSWIYKYAMPAVDSNDSNITEWIVTGDIKSFRKDVDSIVAAPYGLQQNLYDHWLANYKGSEFNSSMQISFFKLCGSYRDILYHQKKRVEKGCAEDIIMESYVMHSLNHVFKTRDLVTQNHTKLPKTDDTSNEKRETANCFRDEGFPQPKVLIVIPFRRTARRLVEKLIHLTPSPYEVDVELMDQFDKEYGSDACNDNDELEAEDPFMMGISLTGYTIELCSDFSSSDLIIATPFGLINRINLAKANVEKNLNCLSSVEILVVDLGDVNTSCPKTQRKRQLRIKQAVNFLNMLDTHQLLRPWYDGLAKFYRQTIVLCSNLDYDIIKLYRTCCLNYEGKLRLSASKEACCTLALAYPVGYSLKKLKENSALVIDESSPNIVVVHGLFDIMTLKWQKERFSEEQTKSLKFPSAFVDKLRSCMANQGPKACLTHIRSEIWKHCKNIPCVNMYSYAKFAVWLYRIYKFNMLLSFIFRTILEGSVVVTRHSYLRYDWIGIKFSDMIDIALTFLAFRSVPDAVSFQLIRKKEYTFLHEVHVVVKENGHLAKRSEPRVYINGEKEAARRKETEGDTGIPLHTIILFRPGLDGLPG